MFSCLHANSQAAKLSEFVHPLATLPGNDMTFLVESVRRYVNFAACLGPKQPGRARRANYPLSLQRYCDTPSGRLVKILVKFERKKDGFFQRRKLFCVNML